MGAGARLTLRVSSCAPDRPFRLLPTVTEQSTAASYQQCEACRESSERTTGSVRRAVTAVCGCTPRVLGSGRGEKHSGPATAGWVERVYSMLTALLCDIADHADSVNDAKPSVS